MTARTRKVGWAAVAATTAVATAWGTAAQASTTRHFTVKPSSAHQLLKPSSWQGKTAGIDRSTPGRAAYFVQLRGESAVQAGKVAGRSVPSKVLSQRAVINGNTDRAFASARSADPQAAKLYTTTNLVPGFAVNTDLAGVKALATRSDVAKVSRIIPKTVSNANTANLVHALQTWKSPGSTGQGVRIGVIDTGVDYTHADFGGPGTQEAYQQALDNDTKANWRASLPKLGQEKVIGGYDLAGDTYNADPDAENYQPIPHPDKNPLDCTDHGTHVAGIAAGYGVTKGGKTFTGKYNKLDADKLMNMRIGPGMAPEAQLYSLRVFGCEGSTDLVMEAFDRAMDPNQDGNTKDHFDMINLSVGSDDGTVDDPENAFVAQLAANGVLPVISMGNGGDNTDIGGAPGNAPASLAVASSVDSFQMRDGLKVNAPADVAGIAAGQFSIAYDWAHNGPSHLPVTGDVVKIPTSGAFDEPAADNDTDGCTALTDEQAAAVAGKVVWLYWDDNDATRRCGSAGRGANVAAAGAAGAIFTSSLDVFNAGITGVASIPIIQLPKAQVDKLTPAVDAGTLNVTFDGALQATVKDITPAITDTLSSFSSRGPHGSMGVVKPDVTAPGDTIASAGMGTGNNVLVISGTSMASPLVAGVAALVKSKHPTWTPQMLKAAVMNTATHDLWTGSGHTGHRYGPARVGSGRVDARAAVQTQTIAYVKGANQTVSASFGVVPALINGGEVVKHKTLVVRNLGNKPTSYAVGYDAVNPSSGVTFSVSKSSVTVPAHQSRTVTVTLRVDPTQLVHSLDPTMTFTQSTGFGDLPRTYVSDSSGHLTVTPQGKKELRVPAYAAAKPVSDTTASSSQPGQIDITGDGVDQGTSAEDAYVGFASVMELGATSQPQPKCTLSIRSNCWTNQSDRAGDIQYVGAGTGTAFGDPFLYFGISTHQDWANLNTMTPYVDVDTDGDDFPDIEIYAQNDASAQGRTDVLLAYTVDYKTGDILDIEPVNMEQWDVDTDVYDTNVIVLPMDLTYVADGGPDLTGPDAEINYWGATANGYTGHDQDRTSEVTGYKVGSPDLVADEDPVFEDGAQT
ncbi:MAG TPA: S8 family serine peptidase, partial [Nocardioides sp.]|nr:S8 family serine peptidase [Nocardioides sp.]